MSILAVLRVMPSVPQSNGTRICAPFVSAAERGAVADERGDHGVEVHLSRDLGKVARPVAGNVAGSVGDRGEHDVKTAPSVGLNGRLGLVIRTESSQLERDAGFRPRTLQRYWAGYNPARPSTLTPPDAASASLRAQDERCRKNDSR